MKATCECNDCNMSLLDSPTAIMVHEFLLIYHIAVSSLSMSVHLCLHLLAVKIIRANVVEEVLYRLRQQTTGRYFFLMVFPTSIADGLALSEGFAKKRSRFYFFLVFKDKRKWDCISHFYCLFSIYWKKHKNGTAISVFIRIFNKLRKTGSIN